MDGRTLVSNPESYTFTPSEERRTAFDSLLAGVVARRQDQIEVPFAEHDACEQFVRGLIPLELHEKRMRTGYNSYEHGEVGLAFIETLTGETRRDLGLEFELWVDQGMGFVFAGYALELDRFLTDGIEQLGRIEMSFSCRTHADVIAHLKTYFELASAFPDAEIDDDEAAVLAGLEQRFPDVPHFRLPAYLVSPRFN